MDNSDTIKSYSYDQHEILLNIMKMHDIKQFDCDVTYGKGNFYKNGVPEPKLAFDLKPRNNHVLIGDSRHIPMDNATIKTVVFDPPFVMAQGPSLNNNKDGQNVISTQFSSFKNFEQLIQMYRESIQDIYRVLEDNGMLIFKCQDCVCSGINNFTHIFVATLAMQTGFYVRDMYILLAKNRVISGKVKQQHHARKFHSYFYVLEKNNKGKRFLNYLDQEWWDWY